MTCTTVLGPDTLLGSVFLCGGTLGSSVSVRITGTNTLGAADAAGYTIATRITVPSAVSDQATPGYRIDTRIR